MMASRQVTYSISLNGRLLSKASVAENDQLEAALAKLMGEHEPILSVTVFSPSARYPNKHISWQAEQIGIGDEIVIRIDETEGPLESSIKSFEELEAEPESRYFCSFCAKGEREI